MPFYEALESRPYVRAMTGSDYYRVRGEAPREGTVGLSSGYYALVFIYIGLEP
jgi:hypothetical protein